MEVFARASRLAASLVSFQGTRNSRLFRMRNRRHTNGALMLEGSADIRFIQAMLGQADLKVVPTSAAVGKNSERPDLLASPYLQI